LTIATSVLLCARSPDFRLIMLNVDSTLLRLRQWARYSSPRYRKDPNTLPHELDPDAVAGETALHMASEFKVGQSLSGC